MNIILNGNKNKANLIIKIESRIKL